jgi:hypothetical protein
MRAGSLITTEKHSAPLPVEGGAFFYRVTTMESHCAVRCPVVTEAVKAATPESRINMAIAAIESEKISERAAAERFEVPHMTLVNRRKKTATVPNGPVAATPPKAAKGKDGKERKPPATPEEIARAWAMRDSSMSTPAIAKDLGRGERTVRDWFAKERPKSVQAPAPAPEVQNAQPEAPAAVSPSLPSAPAPRDPSLPLPELSNKLIASEKKAAPKRTAALANLAELNTDMEKLWKAAQKHFEKEGRSVLRNHQGLADQRMVKDGVLKHQCEAIGLKPDSSYLELLRAIDVAGKKLSQSARQAIYLFGYTETLEP